MPRYIDADALIVTLENVCSASNNVKQRRIEDLVLHGIVPQIIDDAPTADVQLVKHGKWILHTEQIVDVDIKLPTECSECDFEKFSAEKYNFCPNCGARMDGENNETNQ